MNIAAFSTKHQLPTSIKVRSTHDGSLPSFGDACPAGELSRFPAQAELCPVAFSRARLFFLSYLLTSLNGEEREKEERKKTRTYNDRILLKPRVANDVPD